MKLTKCHYRDAMPIGQQNNCQLWNPAESAVSLDLSRVVISSVFGGGFNIIATQTPLTFRSKGALRTLGPTEEDCKAVGVGEWREGVTTNWGQHQLFSYYVVHVQPNGTLPLPIDFKILPGWGLIVVGRGNHDCGVTFDWDESSV